MPDTYPKDACMSQNMFDPPNNSEQSTGLTGSWYEYSQQWFISVIVNPILGVNQNSFEALFSLTANDVV